MKINITRLGLATLLSSGQFVLYQEDDSAIELAP